MAEISKNTLMFVDDPKETLESLFKHPEGVITDSSFIEIYKKIKFGEKSAEKSVGETKAETHLGTLRIYDLVESVSSLSKGSNRITSKGKLLKDIWKKEKNFERNVEFKHALANILLTNPYKGELFKKFLKFIENERTKKVIKEKFRWRTGYTILNWSLFAGLVIPVGNERYKKNHSKAIKKNFSNEKIWEFVKKAYDEVRKIDYDKKRLIVDFSDIRFRASYLLGLSDFMEFDKYFTRLMDSEYRKFINLHGALTGDYNEEKNFTYKRRLYPNISLIINE